MSTEGEGEEGGGGGGKDNKERQLLTWQEKKKVVDHQRKALENELADLSRWINDIETMDDQKLKEYLQNRPEHLKTKIADKSTPKKRVQRTRKSKYSGIMATVWKFHKEDGDQNS